MNIHITFKFLASFQNRFRSLKYLVAYTIIRALQLVILLLLLTHSLFFTQQSEWNLGIVSQITLHPCIKLSNASHYLEENAKSSKWSATTYLIWSLLNLITYHYLSFLLCFSYTAIPVVLWTCKIHFLLRTFAHAFLFFLAVSYSRCKHVLISLYNQVAL